MPNISAYFGNKITEVSDSGPGPYASEGYYRQNGKIKPIVELSLLNDDGSLRSDYSTASQDFLTRQYLMAKMFKYDEDARENINNLNQENRKLSDQNDLLNNDSRQLRDERDFYRDRWNANRPKVNPGEISSAPKFTNEANDIMRKFDGNQWGDNFRAKVYSDIANGNFSNFINWPKEVQDAVMASGLLKNDPRQTPVTPHINLDNTVRAIGNTMVSPSVNAYNMIKDYIKR